MNSEDELRSQLSGLPSPPMPDDVTAAITARLESEAAGHAGTGDDAEVIALTPSHQRRLSGLLIAAAVAGIMMLLAVTIQTPTPGSGTDTDQPVLRAGAIYEPRDFARELSRRFQTAPAATGATNTFADSPEGIAECTDEVDAFGRVLGIDTGSYDKNAVVVLVTTYPAHSEYEEVWVVTPTCGTGDPVVIRHMVYDVDGSTATL